LLITLALIAGCALLFAVAWKRHRMVGLGSDTAPPDQRIVRAWERAQRALRRRGLGRQPSETPEEYAARLDLFEQRSARVIGAGALQQLASLVELACYTPRPCTAGHADAARGHASVVINATRRRR
jgi:hypothetical protein